MKKEHFRKRNKPLDGEGLFVDSWSSLKEYLSTHPKRVKSVKCPEKDRRKLQDMMAQHGVTFPIDEGETLRVYIEEKFADEQDLDESISLLEKDVIVALDHITDTRNLGAILRSAAFFGVKRIVVPNDRQAPITQGTISTCQGALAFTTAYSVVNLKRTLKSLKSQGYWVVGADMGGEPLERYASKFEKVVLVMGSEDKGLSKGVHDACDVIVSIQGTAPSVESLNVSVASGILIQQFGKSLLTV